MTQPPNPAQKTPEQRGSQTPLQILPAMLHAVFCQTADVFNAPHRQQPRAVIHTNAQIRTSVSVCNQRFQYALDLLEMDILKAKATLRRDLSRIRAAAEAESAAREAELQKERDRLAAKKADEERAAEEVRKKAEAERKAAEEKEEEIKRQAIILEQEKQQQLQLQLQLQQKQKEQEQEQDTVMIDSTPPPPTSVQQEQVVQQEDGGFDFLFDEEKITPAPQRGAPPAPMQVVQAPAGNFDDFLASMPLGEVVGDDGGMGGGQPLEDSDLFGSEFNDLFGYGT